MWKPNIEKKQGLIGHWLENRKRKSANMDSAQFHFKEIHRIKKSQEPLGENERSQIYIPKEAKTAYPGETGIEVRFCSTEKAAVANLYLYGARKDDDIVEVASGFIVTGFQETKRHEQVCYYINNILINDTWLSPIGITKGSVSRIVFKTHGYHRFFARLKFTTGEWFVDMVGCAKW